VSFSVHKGVKITATAPPGVEGAVNMTVTTPEGVSAITTSERFFYVPPGPLVLELAPSEGPVIGGQEVKIFGAHFEGATEVTPAAKKHGVDSVIVSVKGNEPEHSKASPAAEFTYE
jgi:hypothetical protein